MWKPQPRYRWKLLRLFHSHIRIHNYSVRLWKFIVLVVLLSISISSYAYSNKRYQPSNKNCSKYIESIANYDDRFLEDAIKKCPISERPFSSSVDGPFSVGCKDPFVENQNQRLNAAFVVLARNSEIDGVILSMRSLERRFNQWFNYPWIFLNDEPFTEEFKTRVAEVASGEYKFGVIPKDEWSFREQSPTNENHLFFEEAIENQGDRGIMYGNMQSYHSMCRFYSGYFFNHPLVEQLDWYWRVEPEVEFYCDLTYDPFLEMERKGKKYGFTIAIKELMDTVPSLFRYTKYFINEYDIQLPNTWKFFTHNYRFFKGSNENQYLDVTNLNDFFNKLELMTKITYSNNQILKGSNDKSFLEYFVLNSKTPLNKPINERYDNENFNMCHFWSNFEIASTQFFKSHEYQSYLSYLENSRGFYTERWGDAPIHSLAIGMFLSLDEIHYFRDIGYKHSTIGHCPFNSMNQKKYKSSPAFKHQVLPEDEIKYADYDQPAKTNWIEASGCRCRCPSDHQEVENTSGSCSSLWLKLTSDDYVEGVQDPNFIGGLGEFNSLDLDKIEELAIRKLEIWLQKGYKIKDWRLSDKERDRLSTLYINKR